MNWLDAILILPPLAFAIRGVQKGFFKQLFSLGALLLASGLAIYANRSFVMALWTDGDLVNYFHANMTSIILILVIVLVLFLYLGSLLTKMFNALRIGSINRFFGGIVGLAKGCVVSLLMVFAIQAISLHVEDWHSEVRKNSLLLPYAKSFNAAFLTWFLGDEEVDWFEVLPEAAPRFT